jgi:hypothetical protein
MFSASGLMCGAYSKQDPFRVRVGSLQERQHSLLRPCYCPVLESGRMPPRDPQLRESPTISIESRAIGSVTFRSLPVFFPVTREAGPTETSSPLTASTASVESSFKQVGC